jgi:hypothetical protein
MVADELYQEWRPPNRRLKTRAIWESLQGAVAYNRRFGGDLEIAPPWSKQICILPKIFRTAAQPRCQIKQVKAIRAAARFPYLVFLRVRCPNPFFGIYVPCVANDSVSFS